MGRKEGGLTMDEKNEIISQSNALTSSRYDFSSTEKNVIYHIIKKVRHDYVEGTMQRDLFDNLIVHINARDLANIADEDHTKRARKALRDLRHKDIEIEDEQGNWLNVGFINYAKHIARTKTYEVEVSREIMPHLVELARNFTSYSLTVAISLKSKYSQRFYEWAHQYIGRQKKEFFLDIENLRQMLKLGKGYSQKQDMKRFIIDVAMKELKTAFDDNRSDLWLEYREQGRGKETRFFFKIHTKEDEEAEKIRFNEVRKLELYVYNTAKQIFKRDQKFCDRILKALDFDPDKIQPVFDKLTKLEKDYKGQDLAKLFRYVLREDFGIS